MSQSNALRERLNAWHTRIPNQGWLALGAILALVAIAGAFGMLPLQPGWLWLLPALLGGAAVGLGLVSAQLEPVAPAPTTDTAAPLRRMQSQLKEVQEGLDAALDDNIRLREALDNEQAAEDLSLVRLKSLVRATGERVLITDSEAKVVAISQSAATLLGVRSNEVDGRECSEILHFFDAYKDNPEEYPLTELVEDIIERGSTMLTMTDVIVLDGRKNTQKMMLLSEAVLSPQGRVVGALLRLQTESEEEKGAPSARGEVRDATTDLPTRGEFNSRLTELLHIARSQDATHQLLLIGVDNLQEVYDDIGYWAGEELLWSVARMIRSEMSGTVELFRITAMHFALLLPHTKDAPADRVAESIRLAIEAGQFAWNERSYRSTVSIGIVRIDSEALGSSALISQADTDLRVARERGGNLVHRHGADDLLMETQAIEAKLVEWLDGEDNAHLQLQSCGFLRPNGDLGLMGAMLRVEMEDGFWVDPAAFQSSAESSGLSHSIDVWLLRKTLDVMSGLEDRESTVLIPVSGQSLEHDAFLEEINAILRASQVAPARVVLALDERAARNRPALANRFSKALRELELGFGLRGCRVAALADLIPRLKPRYVGLPAGTVAKADRALVGHELSFFAAAAEELDFEIFAEGVDREDQRKQLHRLGVHWIGDKGGPMGPLSEFAGLRTIAR